MRSAPLASRFRHAGSRMIVFAVNDRRSPAVSTSGNSASPPGGASVARVASSSSEDIDEEIERAVRRTHAFASCLVVVDAERHPARAGEDGIEQCVAEIGPVADEAGPLEARPDSAAHTAGQPPTTAQPRQPRLEARAERAIQDHRRQRSEIRVFGHELPGTAEPKAARPVCRGVGQRREVDIVERAKRLDEPSVDLRLRQAFPGADREPAAEMEVVARELEVEERRLPLLELRRGR